LASEPTVRFSPGGWEASEDRAEAKAIYRMPGNERFDRVQIVRAHREAMIRRMAGYGGMILAVQDTTGVNYNTHVKTEGIGISATKHWGSTPIVAWRLPQTGWFFGGRGPVELQPGRGYV
jgi:hypothetical protein